MRWTHSGHHHRNARPAAGCAPSALGGWDAENMLSSLSALPVPVEKTEEGQDYPPIVDYQPGLPGRKNAPPNGSTAELFREYQHFGLRRTWADQSVPTSAHGPSIMLPKTCEVVSQDTIAVDRPLADCGNSRVLQVKLRINATSAARTLAKGPGAQYLQCVARLVREPTRQFWREVGVWSALRHDNIVRFVGVCISAQGETPLRLHPVPATAPPTPSPRPTAARVVPFARAAAGPLSLCLHFPEGSVYEDNAKLRASNATSAPISWGLRCGWTIVSWTKQLVSAMNYLHGLKPWPVLYRNLKSSNLMLSENHSKSTPPPSSSFSHALPCSVAAVRTRHASLSSMCACACYPQSR